MKTTAGETVLLKEGSSLRWVRIVHAAPEQHNGKQNITVQNCDQYGRTKARHVRLDGRTNKIEWAS